LFDGLLSQSARRRPGAALLKAGCKHDGEKVTWAEQRRQALTITVVRMARRKAKGRGVLPLDEVASRGKALPHSG
jgi:hypothetical protein